MKEYVIDWQNLSDIYINFFNAMIESPHIISEYNATLVYNPAEAYYYCFRRYYRLCEIYIGVVMIVRVELDQEYDLWPKSVINFNNNSVTKTGVSGFNAALTEHGIRAKLMYVGMGASKLTNIWFILEFETADDYTEFMLRWS